MKRILSLFFCLLALQLSSEITWNFPATSISSPGFDASSPNLGTDVNGNLVAVWVENNRVVSKTQLLNSSWSALSTLSGNGGNSPDLAVDSNGNAIVVWVEGGVIKSATKLFGQAWGAAQTISSSGSSAPKIAVDRSSGNAVAVWTTSGVIKASSKSFGGAWSLVPDTLSLIANSDSPQISISPGGIVIAVWHAVNPVSLVDTIYTSRKTSLLGLWSAAATISNSSQKSAYPQIATDSAGNATVLWYRFAKSGSSYSDVVLQASSLDSNGVSWTSPQDLSTPSYQNPQYLTARIGYGPTGKAIAAWTTLTDGGIYYVESAQLDPALGWGTSSLPTADIYSISFDLSVIPSGIAYLSYMISDSANIAIQGAESQIGGVFEGYWASPSYLSSYSSNSTPVITSITQNNTTNYIAAGWLSYDGANTVMQVVPGSEALAQPPTNLAVAQLTNGFGSFTEYYNRLSWDASVSSGITQYLIYRNGTLIAQNDESTLYFEDHNASQIESVTYGVAAMTDGYLQSSTAIKVFTP